MKLPEKAARIWYLVIAFYIVPLLLSISQILNTDRLLGDFTHSTVTDGHAEIIFAGVVYLLPLACIISIVRVADRIRIGNFKREFASYLYWMLITVTILAVIFGLPSIGEAGGGIPSIIRTIILKFNPNIIFLLFTFSNSSTRRLVIGTLCIAVIGYEQKSLLPALLIFMSISVHYITNNPVSRLRFIIYTLITVVTALNIDYLIVDLYQLRNDLRGSSAIVEFELVKSYALGRINSFSSFYYIWSENCCASSPDVFYVAGNVLERFVGLPLSTLSPTQIFNEVILGSDSVDYGIFTSFAGSLMIEGRASPVILITSMVSYFIFIVFAYKITPLSCNAEKKPLFLLLFYFPYLSGDVWEFSILIQSLVVISMTIIGIRLLKCTLNVSDSKQVKLIKSAVSGIK